jgi:hypothetical protein
METPVNAVVLGFPLDELRRAFCGATQAGADSRNDTTPFRAFRQRLLEAAARTAVASAELSVWWEGTFNGYALAVQAWPADAVPGLAGAAAEACGIAPEPVRLAPPRQDGYPLARIQPGGYTLARGEDGLLAEAPFGAPTGHFGAPGMRRIR